MSVTFLLCMVLAVQDGDTIKVRCPARTKPFTVRVAEIDSPELAHPAFGIKLQPYGPESRASLSALCQGKPATVRRVGFDQHQRAIGQVSCAGVDTASYQVTAGMAWSNTAYLLRGSKMPALEAVARAQKVGLWADPAPIAPWVWRKPSGNC